MREINRSPQSTRSTQSFNANKRSSPQITRINTDLSISQSVLICVICGELRLLALKLCVLRVLCGEQPYRWPS